MKLVYPIILYPMEEHEGGYTVEVPDLPGFGQELSELAMKDAVVHTVS